MPSIPSPTFSPDHLPPTAGGSFFGQHTLDVACLSSIKATLEGKIEAARFRRYALAESAMVTRAAPIMIASLMTSLPAPLR